MAKKPPTDPNSHDVWTKPERQIRRQLPPAKTHDRMPRDGAHNAFAARLQAFMNNKGWKQADLARYAELQMPNGKRFGRDSINNYLKEGGSFPDTLHEIALCLAFGVKREELIPTKGVNIVGEATPTFDLRDLGDGNVWLRINQSIPWEPAMEIMAAINKANGPQK